MKCRRCLALMNESDEFVRGQCNKCCENTFRRVAVSAIIIKRRTIFPPIAPAPGLASIREVKEPPCYLSVVG
jgi:hypothetical protein